MNEKIKIDYDLDRLRDGDLLYALQSLVAVYSRSLKDRKQEAADFFFSMIHVLLATGLRESDSQAVAWWLSKVTPDETAN